MYARAASWLCPTAQDRARALDAGGRVKQARTIAAAACAVALVATAPWVGWWLLLLLAIVTLNLATLDRRMGRAGRPEWVAARSMLLVLAVLAVGAALSGGANSPLLPWLVFPSAVAAARFRPTVIIAFASLTAAVMVAVGLAVDAGIVIDDPSRLIMCVTLVAGVTAITTALTRGELEHRHRAALDPLTGLLNRESLETRVAEIEQQARLSGDPVSLVVLDLDHFKRVNDEQGHATGDRVLCEVAYEMRKSLRSFELVYRIGGEEFLVLLPGVDLAGAIEIGDRIRVAISESTDLTISAGVASAAGGDLEYDALFHAGDAALLQAKRDGRDRLATAGFAHEASYAL
jgi:diguanylate cyclase (GGDEF)-like protein